MPAFDEYLENGIWSIGTVLTMAIMMMGMEEADEDAYQWLINFDAKILRAMCILTRLYNDVQSNEVHYTSILILHLFVYMTNTFNLLLIYIVFHFFFKDEEKRGGQLSGISCYMKEYGISKKGAIKAFQEKIKDGWKDLNEGFMERQPTPVARQILMGAFNIARASDVFYKDDDGFTKPEISLKNYITKVLIDPILLSS